MYTLYFYGPDFKNRKQGDQKINRKIVKVLTKNIVRA